MDNSSKNKIKDLFSEWKNFLFVNLYQVLKNKESCTKEELEKKLRGNRPFEPTVDEQIQQLIDIFFVTNTDNKMIPRWHPDLPELGPTIAEKEWLRTMIHSKFAFLFTDVIQPLNENNSLQNISALPSLDSLNQMYPFPPGTDTTDKLLANDLRIFNNALLQQKEITYALSNETQKKIAAPFRLEFDAATQCFSYILFLPSEQTFKRYPADQLHDIEMMGKENPAGLTYAFSRFLEKHKKTLTFSVKIKNHAAERAFSIFSTYEKKVKYDENTKLYIVDVNYYDFDEEEVIRKIISLNADASVIEPKEFKDKVIHRFQQIYSLYK